MSDEILQHLQAGEEDAIARLCEFLSIASISTDPEYADHCQAAAEWIAERLNRLEISAELMESDGHPVVVAKTDEAGPNAPRMLFYGHYDVQPPDPVEKWDSPPFSPSIRDGRIYARGACDDKGQLMTFIEAVRAWRQAGKKLPVNITVLIEGDEEQGSHGLEAFIANHRELLSADVAIVSDTAMWCNTPTGEPIPAITYGLRGLLYYDVKLYGPTRDLHSGVYGGMMSNPATELMLVLGQLFDADHHITVPEFYDDVQTPTEAEREMWQALAFDDAKFAASIGVDALHGVAGFDTLQRGWARPSCDVNGLYGGYMGEGAKTVIPTFAGAKVSFRLAADQNPQKIDEAFRGWLDERTPPGCRWEITDHGQATPVIVPIDSPYLTAAKAALAAGFGQPPVLVREGATIPVVALFKQLLNIDTMLIGFGQNDDAIHSPNEKFDLINFRNGCRTHAALLSELAN